MKVLLPGLSAVQLEKIADTLERPAFNGEVKGVVGRMTLEVPADHVCGVLAQRIDEWGAVACATVLRAVAAERHGGVQLADRRLELVWTGPERDGTATRDTAIVVRELFSSAERDVLVAGYALYNARSIFEPLAERMASKPAMRVRLVLNVGIDPQTSTAEGALSAFRSAFRKHHWPEVRLPTVYYDPRALAPIASSRAVMHAKCVVVDGRRCFLTSANLTEAAQARNIELGVVVNDSIWTKSVVDQFDHLIARGDLRQVDM
jgi:phosphatidylserine/phosphatidylglycerophosphate/cardiolipin synthase-like enzyme